MSNKIYAMVWMVVLVCMKANSICHAQQAPQTRVIWPASNAQQLPKFSNYIDLNDSLKFDSLTVERLIKESEAYLIAMNLDSALIKADSASLGNYFVIDPIQSYEVRILVGSILEKVPKKSKYAEDSYLAALDIAQSMNRSDLVLNAMDCLFHYYETRKEYEKALSVYREREALLDQMDKKLEVAAIQHFNDSIASLNSELRHKQKELVIQKDLRSMFQTFFYVAAGLVLLLLILFFVILSRSAKKKKQIQEQGIQSLDQEKTNTLDKEKLLEKQSKELTRSALEITKLRYLITEQLKYQDAVIKTSNEGLTDIISEARLQLELIGRDPSSKVAVDKYMTLQNLLTKASGEARTISGNIFTSKGTLAERIESLCNNYVRSNLKIDFIGNEPSGAISQLQQMAILSIVDELLLNIEKHAEATTVNVALKDTDGKYVLSVDDNGRGFDVTSSMAKGSGIRRVIAMVTYLNGDLDIVSDSKKGTHYNLEWPK
jgi:two-component system NarL family sensor kinase